MFQQGEIVNIAIKGVQVLKRHSDGTVLVQCGDGQARTMPPQAVITRADDDEQGDRIAAVLAYLDRLESEGGLDPSVPATVREVLDLSPRHWPPRPGDVWGDGFSFDSLWFVQTVVGEGGRPCLAMVPVRRDADQEDSKTPEEWRDYAIAATLAYRKEAQ